jgi:hypothetical protein
MRLALDRIGARDRFRTVAKPMPYRQTRPAASVLRLSAGNVSLIQVAIECR